MNTLMMNISTLLIVAAGGVFIGLQFNRPLRWLSVSCLILLSVTIPVAGSNTWLWINGAVGELSIVSLLFLTGFVLRSLVGWNLIESQTRVYVYFLILLTGSMLYPATLGLSQFDPYSLGYGLDLSLLLLSLSILYWIFKQYQIAIILLLVVAAGETGLLSSLNTWDYLVDPLLWILSPVILIIMFVGSLRRSKTAA
ncbi:MAG: hypothetical protein WBM38_14550 [Arenicellales bacterium]|jgi:hypothetical protein